MLSTWIPRLAAIPFQTIADRAAAGTYRAKPARVFPLERIPDARRLMESNQANGKIVVTTDAYLPPEGTKTGSRAGKA
jgi:NADPH:quinone reductase-like Zn-dependent oxidoreductase